MRLTQQEKEIIKKTIAKFDPQAKILLFGSRADPKKRGGDIDLLLITNAPLRLKEKLQILASLEIAGIERKVDLIIYNPSKPKTAIIKEALQKGVQL